MSLRHKRSMGLLEDGGALSVDCLALSKFGRSACRMNLVPAERF